MFVAFMLKHTILIECRARLFEVEFKFHLNLINFQSYRNRKGFYFGKNSFPSLSSPTLGAAQPFPTSAYLAA